MSMEANLKIAELLSIKKYSPICLLFLSLFFFLFHMSSAFPGMGGSGDCAG